MFYAKRTICCVLAVFIGFSNAQVDTTTAAVTTSTADTTTSAKVEATTTEICEDDPTVNCTKLVPQCSDSRYDELMNKYCRKTCNRCGSSCADTSNQCKVWKNNGFCHSDVYPIDVKKEFCKKTCDMC
ncbi:shTK domain protein [Ancylostoma caninum]|uniref:ShTK domain protein n=1 Tax=Ancylostoma caninum TaxID=29170 RepID=A0A368G8Q2_ANCCA|nr:shTK domain protein [Ancylostoma caninum]